MLLLQPIRRRALICLNARVHISQTSGTRTVPLESFFRGPGETVLSPRELVLGIEVPLPPERTSGCYLRHTPRQDMDIAVVGVAALMVFDVSYKQCHEARIALGSRRSHAHPCPFGRGYFDRKTDYGSSDRGGRRKSG